MPTKSFQRVVQSNEISALRFEFERLQRHLVERTVSDHDRAEYFEDTESEDAETRECENNLVVARVASRWLRSLTGIWYDAGLPEPRPLSDSTEDREANYLFSLGIEEAKSVDGIKPKRLPPPFCGDTTTHYTGWELVEFRDFVEGGLRAVVPNRLGELATALGPEFLGKLGSAFAAIWACVEVEPREEAFLIRFRYPVAAREANKASKAVAAPEEAGAAAVEVRRRRATKRAPRGRIWKQDAVEKYRVSQGTIDSWCVSGRSKDDKTKRPPLLERIHDAEVNASHVDEAKLRKLVEKLKGARPNR